MFIISLQYVEPLEVIDALMSEHVAWLKKHYASGTFIASGRKIPRDGGVILASCESRSRLEEIILEDPFVDRGAAVVELIEFQPSMTAKGAEILKSL